MAAGTSADLPRLAFADWLDDAGDADRAEFVRLQCRFDRWDGGGLQGDEYA